MAGNKNYGYAKAVDYILDIPRFAAKIGTENLKVLMEKLGNPHLRIKTVHVAGTNGKGSVTEMLRSVLTEAGYVTASYTSPHLVSINERMRIDGVPVSDERFTECFEKVREKSLEMQKEGRGHPSFFEFVFAMAAVYFYEEKVDYAVFETGLGGRLDATNVLSPLVSVITSIGKDHEEYLGDTIEKIAFEKAGIIKKEVPVVYHTKSSEADRVIFERAKELSAPCYPVEKAKVIINEISVKSIDFSIESSYYNYHNLKIKKTALYQTDNAATAITAVKVLLPELADEYIYRGLHSFSWPGRMEGLTDRVILDGAHNDVAIKEFIKTVNSLYRGAGNEKIKLLFAVSNDKDYEDMIRDLVTGIRPDTVYVTETASKRSTDSVRIADIFRRCNFPEERIFSGESSVHMFDMAYDNLKSDELLFCVGSLYLIGEIKGHFGRKYR